MPSLRCAATCGWRPRVFHCPPPTLIYGKYRPLCTTGLSIPLLTPLELRKVQPGRPLAPAAAGRPFPTPRPTRNSQDHPNTHRKASVNESFPAPKGRRIGKRRKPHHTPKLWSWLNPVSSTGQAMAEIEFSVLARAYIKKRIAAATTSNRRSIAREPVLAATGGRRSQTARPPTHSRFNPEC